MPTLMPLPTRTPSGHLSALMDEVQRCGGVARARTLAEAGHSPHHIAAAVQAGLLVRVRRLWVARRDADAELVAAARHGVVLSCITQARRLGLWVLAEDRPHVAASSHGRGGKPAHAHVHWSKPVVPRHPDALEDPLENVLALVAGCQPREVALAVWESALQQELVDRAQLAQLPLRASARDVLDEAMPFAGSGLETIFVTRLRWLRVRIIPQVWILGHRVDFLIGERLVVQLDGGHHVGRQRAEDIAHDAALMAAGYHIIRVSYGQVIDEWAGVQARIQGAIARGLHRAA